MPAQHTYRPKHLALAIALSVGCTEFVLAQQTSAVPSAAPFETSGELIAKLDAFIGAADTKANLINKINDWKNLQLDAQNDLVSVLSAGGFTKRLDGGGGLNIIRLDHNKGGTLGETRDFAGLDIKQGVWTLNGAKDSGDFSIGTLIRPEAKLTNNAYIEGGAVAQGALVNNGVIGGNVEVHPSGTFSGRGRVGGLDVRGGLLVNRQLGTPVVAGDLTMSTAAVLTYELNPEGPGETIKVDGVASLNNATLKIVAAGSGYPLTSQHTIISAEKIEGAFGPVLSNLIYMTPSLDGGDGKNVVLTYARNDVPIGDAANNDSARGLAGDIEKTSRDQNAVPNAAVNALLGSDLATATYALEILAGDSNGNLGKATLNSDGPISATLLSAMHQLDSSRFSNSDYGAPRLAAGGEAHGRLWLQALGHSGRLSRDFDPLQHSTEGLLLGSDWQISEFWRLGVMGGNSRTRQKSRELDGSLESWHVGAYALRQVGPMSLRLGATHNSHDGSSARRVEFDGFKDRPQGRYNASTQQAFAEVGYNLGRANVSIEPFANLGYQRYQRDSFTEKGGDAALKVQAQSEENFSSTFGLRLAKLNTLGNGMQLTPRFSAGWKHSYGKVYSETRQRLVVGGNDYSVYSAPLDRDKLMVDAGVDLRLSALNTLGLGLTGEMGSDSRNLGVMGQWSMAF